MGNEEISSSDQQIVQSVASMVRAFRLQRQLNIKQLSRLSGITQQTIAHIESGTGSRVDLVKICRLAEAMELSVKNILEGGGIVSKEDNGLQKNEGSQSIDVVPLQAHLLSSSNVGYYPLGAFDYTLPFISSEKVCFGLDGVTLETWFYPMDSALHGEQKILSLHEKAFHDVYLGWQEDRVWFGIIPGEEDAWFKLRSGPCSLYEWHHVVGVCDGKIARLFIDQTEVGQVSIGDFSSRYFSDRLSVGFLTHEHDELIDDPTQTFKGQITQPSVWTEPMSPFSLKKVREELSENPNQRRNNHIPLKA